MSWRGVVVALPLIVCAGCATKDFSGELGLASSAVDTAEREVAKELVPKIKALEPARQREAAAKGYTWIPSEGCNTLRRKEIGADPKSCFIDKDLAHQPLEIRQADAAMRKLTAVASYFDALNALASAGSGNSLEAAFAEARGGITDLSVALNGGRPTRLGDVLAKIEPKVAATVSFAVKQRRVRLMRQVVNDADPLVETLVSQVVAHLEGAGVDPGYDVLAKRLAEADKRAAEALVAGNTAAVARAYGDLEARQDAFVKHAEKSIYPKVLAIAGTHRGLKAALDRNPTDEEVIAYLESLRTLVSILEEDGS